MRKRPEDCSDGLIAAAEYVRMSTDHQRYSTENQSASIHAYALCSGQLIPDTTLRFFSY
ncbi:recombinase family protein [Pseudomonas avellanae]|uniref:recombinase family protein n=1 Tax=Pseudomonas avellanae TaxID=46257 RepID=UPI003D2FF3B6